MFLFLALEKKFPNFSLRAPPRRPAEEEEEEEELEPAREQVSFFGLAIFGVVLAAAIGAAPSRSREEERPVHDDVMPALHALSKSTNPSRPALVAEALSKLSSITMNLIKIVEGGGTPLLVTLSQSSSAATRRHSCVALCNISYVWAKRDKIIKERDTALRRLQTFNQELLGMNSTEIKE